MKNRYVGFGIVLGLILIGCFLLTEQRKQEEEALLGKNAVASLVDEPECWSVQVVDDSTFLLTTELSNTGVITSRHNGERFVFAYIIGDSNSYSQIKGSDLQDFKSVMRNELLMELIMDAVLRSFTDELNADPDAFMKKYGFSEP